MRPASSFVFTCALAIAAAAPALARFGQENPPVERQLEKFGFNVGLHGDIAGQIATFSGQIPSTLLGNSDPCAQAKLADRIVHYGESKIRKASLRKRYNKLAMTFMAAERNFDPTKAPKFCKDASLPRHKLLRGILPKVDPSRGGPSRGGISAAKANRLTARRLRICLDNPSRCGLAAQGKSIADQMRELGFTDFN
ncbi:MAG: hypothetical protein BJ554DRAFT_6714, partial [Olpidium bornovanus]